MRSILLSLFLFTPILSEGQINRSIYSPYKEKADSIIILFLGQNVLEKYVRLDSGKSQYQVKELIGIRKASFKSRLEFIPDSFEFHYTFTHPRLSGETFKIIFTLDSSGMFIVNNETYGLINTLDLEESKIISKEQALDISKSEAEIIKKNSIALVWYKDTVDFERFKQSRDLADIWTGRIVWKIDGKVRFRGKLYEGALYIDALNGQVTRAFAVPWD